MLKIGKSRLIVMLYEWHVTQRSYSKTLADGKIQIK
jgi:hypothetical protein